MRQRRLPDLEERLKEHGNFILTDGSEYRGRWRERLAENMDHRPERLYLEFGCGKGKFLLAHAEAKREAGFLGIEGQPSVAVKAADYIRREGPEIKNILLLSQYVRNMEEIFAPGELDGLYLNFSDPWPKARHAKRRLTHRRYLESYRRIIRPGGLVECKTDSDLLYEFTLEELQAVDFPIVAQTRDLHGTDCDSRNYPTEYEEKFLKKNIAIKYIAFKIEENKNQEETR